jgi:hypothetical protein
MSLLFELYAVQSVVVAASDDIITSVECGTILTCVPGCWQHKSFYLAPPELPQQRAGFSVPTSTRGSRAPPVFLVVR